MTYQHANNFQQNMNSQTNKKNIIQITNPNSNIMTDMVKHKQTGIPFKTFCFSDRHKAKHLFENKINTF